MKRKTKSTRGPIEYCKLIFWSLSTFKVACSFYHVYWHPTLMDEYNKMQGGNSAVTCSLLAIFNTDFVLLFSSLKVQNHFKGFQEIGTYDLVSAHLQDLFSYALN